MTDDERLGRIQDQVWEASAGDAAYLYTAVDPQEHGVVVHRVGGDDATAFCERYRSLGASIRPSPLSAAQADVIGRAVDRDTSEWQTRGVVIHTSGVDSDGMYRIGVEGASEHAETLLERYGPLFGRNTVRVFEMNESTTVSDMYFSVTAYEREERLQRAQARAAEASAGDPAFLFTVVDPETNDVFVHRVGGDDATAFCARYRSLSTSTFPVRIRPAVLSWEQSTVLRDAIVQDLDSLRAEGIEVQAFGSARDTVFEIGVRNAARHTESLLERYGPLFGRDKLRVIEVNVVSLGAREPGPT
jgi:hypothetical protein